MLALLLLLGSASLPAQAADRITNNTEFLSDPAGTELMTVSRNAAVTFGASRAGWREVTLTGWVKSSFLKPDSRDGFDLSVSTPGAPVRTLPDDAAPARAVARVGVLFNRLGNQGGWTRVRRTGWVNANATGKSAPATPATSPAPGAAGGVQKPPPKAPASTDTTTSDSTGRGVAVQGGTEFSATPDAAPIGQLEATRRAELLERRNGWSRVRLDVWVRDGRLGSAPSMGDITGNAVRADPDRYVGRTVEWSLQVLAVEKADELRPELPLGQPYVLARGPLPETGFVYLVVRSDQVAAWQSLEPLAEVRVRATIRAGKTRYLPTPVLDLVRRLD